MLNDQPLPTTSPPPLHIYMLPSPFTTYIPSMLICLVFKIWITKWFVGLLKTNAWLFTILIFFSTKTIMFGNTVLWVCGMRVCVLTCVPNDKMYLKSTVWTLSSV